jgi:hypothetical protein
MIITTIRAIIILSATENDILILPGAMFMNIFAYLVALFEIIVATAPAARNKNRNGNAASGEPAAQNVAAAAAPQINAAMIQADLASIADRSFPSVESRQSSFADWSNTTLLNFALCSELWCSLTIDMTIHLHVSAARGHLKSMSKNFS